MPSIIDGSDNFDSGNIEGLGVGQTWQDMTASRAVATTYTNSTGRPISIFVSADTTDNSHATLTITVNGTLTFTSNTLSTPPSPRRASGISLIIPDGDTYNATISTTGSGPAIYEWNELRETP